MQWNFISTSVALQLSLRNSGSLGNILRHLPLVPSSLSHALGSYHILRMLIDETVLLQAEAHDAGEENSARAERIASSLVYPAVREVKEEDKDSESSDGVRASMQE